MKNKEILIETRKLKKFFPIKRKSLFDRKAYYVRANEDVSLKIYKNETFGLVGESGCGKSTLGRVILQLYPPTSGSVLYYGMELKDLNPEYVLKEIDALPRYQKRAHAAYQKALVYEERKNHYEKALEEFRLTVDEKDVENKKESIRNQIIRMNEEESQAIEETIACLNRTSEAHPVGEDEDKSKRNEELRRLSEILRNEPENDAIMDLIDLLYFPHKEINACYKRVLRLKKEKSILETKAKETGRNTQLEKKKARAESLALTYKKEASRQLREGSRTCGDYILEKEIHEVSRLMREEQLLKREIYSLEKKVDKLNRLEQEKGSSVDRLNTIDEFRKKKSVLQEKLVGVQKKLKALHHSHVLEITERTLDPEYQAKLAKNKEYAINLQKLNKREMRALRSRLQMIFQDPYSSLDPRMTVGQAISEAVVEHGLFEKGSKELEEYVVETMKSCGLDHYMIHRYPHQFSGGQRQRIVIARALALKPEFVVCDESVSALDVSIQSQILNLLNELKEKKGLTYLFISHDLSVIKHISDRIGVMYLGDLVELSETESLYKDPFHPYSKALISSIPSVTKKRDKIILEGDIPSNITPPSGCKFRTRCPLARRICAKEPPELREVVEGRYVACHFYEETKNL